MKAGKPLKYTGRGELRQVSHVLSGYGLMDGWCCLSFAAAPQQAPDPAPEPASWRASIWNAAIEAAALVVQPIPHVDEERTCGEIADAIRRLKV
jgi:hypothetical protein